ncbi:MAG: hypothetical protein QXZ44_04740 [Ferroplasma sp.]
MKVALMLNNADFDPKKSNTGSDVFIDLDMYRIVDAMGNNDKYIADACERALSQIMDSIDNIIYRQEAVKDVLQNQDAVLDAYNLISSACSAIEKAKRDHYWGFGSESPSSLLYSTVQLLSVEIGQLQNIKESMEKFESQFTSRAFSSFIKRYKEKFNGQFFENARKHINIMKFSDGVSAVAYLGSGNSGIKMQLRENQKKNILTRLMDNKYTVTVDPRDLNGEKALQEIKNRYLEQVASIAYSSSENILNFLEQARIEMAFYAGTVNLYRKIRELGIKTVLPELYPYDTEKLKFKCLKNISLAIGQNSNVVGSSLDLDGKNPIVITGSNRGGKSTFVRSIGCAAIMAQAGMFVPAEEYASSMFYSIFTHFKREESNLTGRLDEELQRISSLIDEIRPYSLLLMNESFSSTNNDEGTAIAENIIKGLEMANVRVFFVTFFLEFINRMNHYNNGQLLIAERENNAARTFKIVPAMEADRGHAMDIYAEIFER